MVEDTILQPKRKRRDIMILMFLLLFARLELSHLSRIQQKRIIRNTGVKTNEAVEILE